MSIETADRPVWSRSQMSSLTECKRKLFFHAAPLEAVKLSEEFRSRVAALKKIKNRHLWTGSLVHEAVADILKIVRQGSPPPAEELFLEQLREKMRQQFKSSKTNEAVAQRLFEHEYRVALLPEIWKGHWDTVENSVRWFFRSSWLKRLCSLGPECWKAVDEILSFDVNGIKAYAKIDCAVEIGGRFILMDWKTSVPDQKAEATLLVGALYAHEVWGAEPENTEAVAVCLLDGKTFHAQITEEALMETHLRIEEESALLQGALLSVGTDPFLLEAPQNPRICQRCSFQGICFPNGI